MSTLTRAAAVGAAAALVTAGAVLPAKAAENGALVFEAVDKSTSTVQLYRIGPGGGALKQLTQPGSPGDWNECPSWSPSGKRVFYDNADRATDAPPQIKRMTAEGKNNTLISKDPKQFDSCPDVSPNGKRIAFLNYGSSGFARVGVMKKDGSDVTYPLSRKNTSYFNPLYSPDGKWLSVTKVAYNKQGQERRADVGILHVRSGEFTNLTKQSDASYDGNGWDPNGKGLVTTKNDKKLVRVFVNGASERLVTKVTGKFVGIGSPVFAPNRSRIAYLVCDGDCGDPQLDGSGAIWTVKKSGAKAKALFTGSDTTNQPADKLDWGVQPPS